MSEYYQVNSIAKKESFKVFVDQLFEKRKFITFTYAFGDSRTRAQQGAMELYFKNAAEELNDAGVYQEINSKFFKKTLTIPWTKYSYKEFWRSVQMAMFGIKSTKDLPAGDVSTLLANRAAKQTDKWIALTFGEDAVRALDGR